VPALPFDVWMGLPVHLLGVPVAGRYAVDKAWLNDAHDLHLPATNSQKPQERF
jgi:hypothetical protein